MIIKILALVCLAHGAWSSLERGPRLDLLDFESGYHGLIREDEMTVEVKPKIRAVGAEICGFRINNRHHGEIPFEMGFHSYFEATSQSTSCPYAFIDTGVAPACTFIG